MNPKCSNICTHLPQGSKGVAIPSRHSRAPTDRQGPRTYYEASFVNKFFLFCFVLLNVKDERQQGLSLVRGIFFKFLYRVLRELDSKFGN